MVCAPDIRVILVAHGYRYTWLTIILSELTWSRNMCERWCYIRKSMDSRHQASLPLPGGRYLAALLTKYIRVCPQVRLLLSGGTWMVVSLAGLGLFGMLSVLGNDHVQR